ncbi:MAG TPA: hypothetical protein VEX15_13645 [Nocardioidaceae bacterium]|nr:hypothetical protein [Nocardioidaceae bacterium]
MRKILAGGAAIAAMAAALFASAANADVGWNISASDRDPSASMSQAARPNFEEIYQLLQLARTTAPYHDVQTALDDGWSEQPMCMDYPDGYMGEGPGTMGHHYFSVEYLTDGGALDPTQPELLVYEKRADGTMRLNAVEYIIPARDLPGTAPAPEMFGGHKLVWHPEVGTAGVWGLHVWLWRNNPHGLYAELNPNVTCDYSQTMAHAHHH